MMKAVKRFSTLVAGGALVALASQCAAQSFPQRTIRFVVPFGTGGAPDVVARIVGKKLSENLGQQVVVDNRAGASGIIAAELVARAPADGYTLFVASIHHLAINPHLYQKLPYDPVRDFTPVTLAVRTPLFLTVSASLPVRSVKELVGYAKSKPGLPFGSSGNGSQHAHPVQGCGAIGARNTLR
jgi:tripartite-type tricarboxylate transporter receptor subunit TctC